MTDAEQLAGIAEAIVGTYPVHADTLIGIALRVRRATAVLDEIVELARIDARVAHAIAVEHLAKYRVR